MSERSEQPHYAAVGKSNGWYVRDMKVPHTEGEVCKAATRNNAEKIAAALNAAEQRDAEQRSEVHWTALKYSLEIAEHDNEQLRELLREARSIIADCSMQRLRREGWLMRYAALQTEGHDG